MDLPTANCVRIGDWYANPVSGEITRDGVTARPDPRAMRLLLYLAERPGQVVSVEELLNQVWSGVIVTPDSVYQAIAAVRRALGDDPKNPTYIATVPRLGYRLIARVSPQSVDEPEVPAGVAVSSLGGSPGPDETRPASSPTAGTSFPPSIGTTAGTNCPPSTSATSSSAEGPPLRSPRRTNSILALCAGLSLLVLLALLIRGEAVRPGPTSANPVKSIAVLPFLDLTSESMDQEYFADGMTEELIDKLSRLPGVRVPSPTSSFYFKGKREPLGQIAKSLGVTYVLSGSVRQSDQKLRIAVRLVRAEDGYVIWSESYDRTSNDKLLVQDDIATQVARALQTSALGTRSGSNLIGPPSARGAPP